MEMTLFDEWVSVDKLTLNNIETVKNIDLGSEPYHGGTSLSSGVLPKWDLLDGKYMIKRCTINDFGDELTDFINESVISEFCELSNILCAEYFPIKIKYMDMESRKILVTNATLTKIFNGDLQHYRILRSSCLFGTLNDELIDFTDKYPNIKRQLIENFLVDFLFNQSDRHSKNFGIVGNELSPLFDSGACLFYDILDSQLTDDLIERIPKHKTFDKKLDDLLKFYLEFIDNDFGNSLDFDILSENLRNCIMKYRTYYSTKRLDFIVRLTERRLEYAREIFNEARRG